MSSNYKFKWFSKRIKKFNKDSTFVVNVQSLREEGISYKGIQEKLKCTYSEIMYVINNFGYNDMSIYQEVELPKYKFTAYCDNCVMDKKDDNKIHMIKKLVPRTTSWCPDCHSALFWNKEITHA